MKKLICVLMVSTAGAFAQQPAILSGTGPSGGSTTGTARATSSISVFAKSVANGGAQGEGVPAKNRNGGSSNSRTRESQTTLELNLRNLSSTPSAAVLEYYFLAQPATGKQKMVWDQGSMDIALEGGGHARKYLTCRELVEVTTNNTTRVKVAGTSATNPGTMVISSQTKSGNRSAGWVLRILVDRQLVRVQASSTELERMGNESNFPANLYSSR